MHHNSSHKISSLHEFSVREIRSVKLPLQTRLLLRQPPGTKHDGRVGSTGGTCRQHSEAGYIGKASG